MDISYILGVDLGTSSIKAVLYDEQLNQLVAVRKGYDVRDGRKVTAILWWKAFLKTLTELSDQVDLKKIACISFSGYNAFVGIDWNLEPVTPVIAYWHTEPSTYMRELFSETEEGIVFGRSCVNLFGSGIMGPALRWLRDQMPEAWKRTDCFLYSSGFLAARLTGHCAVDASRASLTALHDPRTKRLVWDAELCRLFGVDEERLPQILECNAAVGYVTAPAAAQTGLSEGIPVVAGSMDSLCAALGNGIVDGSCWLDIGGTAGGLACVSDKPHPHKRFYLSRYPLPGRWCNNAPLISSAGLFDWFLENLAPNWDMEAYVHAVETSPRFAKGLLFLPYIGGSRFPYWSMDTKGHFLYFTPNCRIEDMARAVVEGLSCTYREILEDFTALGLYKPMYVIAAGGDTRFREWVQSKANYLQICYHLSATPEVSARGAAILGAYHTGMIPDPISWLTGIRSDDTIVIPDKPAEPYLEHYHQYKKGCRLLYQNLANP